MLRRLALAATAACTAAASSSSSPAPPRYNVLLLMADQLRWDAVGFAGINPGVVTPNLDALAARGVRFNRAYTATPSCTPARAALLTGLKPWYHGQLGYGTIAPKYPYEMAVALDAAGVATSVVGKVRGGAQPQARR